jgi:hypothetical protein
MTPGPDAPVVNGSKLSLSTMPKTPDFLFTQVQIDTKELGLKPGESGTVTVSNTAPGVMTLSIPERPRGIEAELDKVELQSGQKATLTVKAGPDAESGVLNLQVAPTMQILPVQITVKTPPVAPAQVEPKELTLKRGESGTVTILRSGPGPMTVSIPAPLPGIESKLDKLELASGEKATLTVTAGPGAMTGVLNLQVAPGVQVLPVQITVK